MYDLGGLPHYCVVIHFKSIAVACPPYIFISIGKCTVIAVTGCIVIMTKCINTLANTAMVIMVFNMVIICRRSSMSIIIATHIIVENSGSNAS